MIVHLLSLFLTSAIPLALGFCQSTIFSPPVNSFDHNNKRPWRGNDNSRSARGSTKEPRTKLPSTSNEVPEAPALQDIHPDEGFRALFGATINATALRGSDTSNQGHDSFRYEWGTWVVDSSLEYLMEQVNRVRIQRGAYERLLAVPTIETETTEDDASEASSASDDSSHVVEAVDTLEGKQQKEQPRRFRLAGGQDWDCFLHVLPPESEWSGRWTTGSWVVVKTLTGLAEVAALKGQPDQHGQFQPRTKRDLRGGADGSLGGGESSAGEDSIKYVGGPLRRYMGKYGKTVLLEMVIRPPIGNDKVLQNQDNLVELPDALENILSIAEPMVLAEEEEMAQEGIEKTTENDSTAGDDNDSSPKHLGEKIGMTFDQVGGLDSQLDAIARRVLASRANPKAARRLGVSHVRGILLSGPPGCGKTLMARELARILGARPPQIVNGPEILDKYIGEAEKRVRELFLPAELEYKAAGDDSALHIIILDEMDAIARKRGTMTADTTGVRDSVVNQLLAKMDGVKEASNVLVVGLTNRPELLDPALLRPGRLEVQLRIELPDLLGRRDILRIHTRRMRQEGGLSEDAISMIDDVGEYGLAARAEHFSGAELAGLVRSAASFALARTLEGGKGEEGIVGAEDIELALGEVQPALGKQDEVLKSRFPLGISPYSPAMERIMRDMKRFVSRVETSTPRLQSLLLVGAGGNGGAGVTALASWAASEASAKGSADYVRFITALDLLCEAGGEEGRAAALVEKFSEAREMSHSLLVLDDVDQLCGGSGPDGYSSVMLSTLRALLRSPPARSTKRGPTDKDKKTSTSDVSKSRGKSLHVIATTSQSNAACNALHEIFEETVVVPILGKSPDAMERLISESLSDHVLNPKAFAEAMSAQYGDKIGCKTVLRLAERAVANAGIDGDQGTPSEKDQLAALQEILDDSASDESAASALCEVF